MPKQIETAAKLFETGNISEADEICCHILEKDQHNSTALHLRGVIAYQSQDYESAARLLEAANQLNPGNINIMFALGASYENNQNAIPAISVYKKICNLSPENTAARQQLAGLLEKNHQLDQALELYHSLNNASDETPETLLSLARIYANSGLNEKASVYAKKLISINHNNADIWNNLGVIFKKIEYTNDAIMCFEKSLSIASADKNKNQTKCRLNLASLLHETGELETAKNYYLQVIKLENTNQEEMSRANYNLGLIYLGNGDFENGWKCLTHRPKKFSDIPSIAELQNKHLLILGEEGLGDELTFLRFIPLLKKHGAKVDYICNPKLLPLLKQLDCIEQLHSSIPPLTNFDYCISAMDLPFILKSNDVSAVQPLRLCPDENQSHEIIDELKTNQHSSVTGITWRAGTLPDQTNTEKLLKKEIPLSELCLALKAITGTIVILQRNPDASEINYLQQHTNAKIIDASSLNNNLSLMLQLLNHVDQYIGVSNTNVHLSGCLGKSCEIIIPFPGEWRWMHKGQHSPWYKNFTLIRQKEFNNWADVKEQITHLHNKNYQKDQS